MTQNELLQFPQEAYPVLYRMYWNPDLQEDKRLENNKDKVSIVALVYSTYYNLTFDSNTLDITYVGRVNPWCIIFKIVYIKNDGTLDYIWEYFDNWVTILNLNRY